MAWSGQWENQIRAKARLQMLVPIGMVIIFILLYFTFHSALEASMVMLSVPFALVGGVYLVSALGYNLSVAVWVGFIALYGIAVETGVVMVIYLHEALDKKLINGPCTEQDIYDATFEGAVLRLRPKLMTVAVALLGLIPIMWSTGTGADVMKPIAAPMIGGMISSAVHVLIMTPVIFVLMKKRDLKKGTLEVQRDMKTLTSQKGETTHEKTGTRNCSNPGPGRAGGLCRRPCRPRAVTRHGPPPTKR